MPVVSALKKAAVRRQRADFESDSDAEFDNLKFGDSDDEAQQQSKKGGASAASSAQANVSKARRAAAAAAVPNFSAPAAATAAKKKGNAATATTVTLPSGNSEDDDDDEDEEDDSDKGEEQSDDDDEGEEGAKPATATVQFVEPANWVERMSLIAARPLPADLDPEDDPRREEAFVQHALLSVDRGLAMLDRAKVPWRRPDDFYAEMFKTDVHMDKIRRSIESTKTAVQERMKRRMVKEQRQFGKQVQAEALRQKAQQKRALMAKVQEIRKRNRGNQSSESKLDEVLGDDDDDERGGSRGGGGKGGGSRKGRHSARGTAFRKKRDLRPGGGSKGKKGGGGGARRPGKNKRK